MRVGIVSSHLMQHTVSRYFTTLIEGLDAQHFDVRIWYGGGIADAGLSKRIADAARQLGSAENRGLRGHVRKLSGLERR